MLEFNNNKNNTPQKDYWLSRLSGAQSLLNLPNAKVLSKVKGFSSDSIRFSLSETQTAELQSFITNQGGNLFIGLLASWNVLFYRYTSQKNIVLGAHLTNSDLDNQNELWENTLLLRSEINPLEGFSSHYETIKASTITDFKYGSYPFTDLKKELNKAFNKSYQDFFNIILSPKVPSDKIADKDKLVSDVAIKITFEEVNNQLHFVITYDADIYSADVIEKMTSHYKQLLSELINNPNISVGKIDFVKDEERKLLLSTLNSELVAYPKEKTLVDLFHEQVTKTPDNIAVVFENRNITYNELDELSNQFANYLISSSGVKAHDLVGVMLDRSEWIIVCLLGVLKSGAAYVPIDPNYPEQRKNYIKNDSQCQVTIDSSLLNDFINTIKNYASERPREVKLSPESLCYIIYTSGTTGNPKGVMIEHRKCCSFVF